MRSLLALAFFLAVAPCWAITIDDFEGDRRALSLEFNAVDIEVVKDLRVVGGRRRLAVVNTSVSGGEASLENRAGFFDGVPGRVLSFGLSNNSGSGVVTWDANGFTADPDPRGLGVIDLRRDRGTEFRLPLVSFDNAGDLTLSLRLYDASVADGSKFSEVTIILNQKWTAANSFPLRIPFALFTSTTPGSITAPDPAKPFLTSTAFGPGGAVDIARVGAIVMSVQGLMTDAIFGPFTTDGFCDKGIPKTNGDVTDRCGVCLTGGTGYSYEKNKAFDACNLCPGETNYQMPSGIKDPCGVCLSGPPPYVYKDTRDDCGACPSSPLFNKGRDGCGVCPADKNYLPPAGSKDVCGVCLAGPASYVYKDTRDDCGACPSSPLFKKGRDGCGLCPSETLYGKAADGCGLCPGEKNYLSPAGSKDQCGVCFSGPPPYVYKDLRDDCGFCPTDQFFGKERDACGQCAGSAGVCIQSQSCVMVQATAEVKKFERGLVSKARSLRSRFLDERSRSERVKCGIKTERSSVLVESAFKVITDRSKEIFSTGVEVCGDSCVTTSYAEQVEALLPQFKIIENEAVALANKVKSCYIRRKIPRTVAGIQGVSQTVGGVNRGLQGLIEQCRSHKVCPPAKK